MVTFRRPFECREEGLHFFGDHYDTVPPGYGATTMDWRGPELKRCVL